MTKTPGQLINDYLNAAANPKLSAYARRLADAYGMPLHTTAAHPDECDDDEDRYDPYNDETLAEWERELIAADERDDEPETVTAEAERHVYGDRNDGYGHPRQNFVRIAAMWTALLQDKLEDGAYVSPEDVARCMVSMKLSRDVHNPRRDNRVDIAGYALALDRLETGR